MGADLTEPFRICRQSLALAADRLRRTLTVTTSTIGVCRVPRTGERSDAVLRMARRGARRRDWSNAVKQSRFTGLFRTRDASRKELRP